MTPAPVSMHTRQGKDWWEKKYCINHINYPMRDGVSNVTPPGGNTRGRVRDICGWFVLCGSSPYTHDAFPL